MSEHSDKNTGLQFIACNLFVLFVCIYFLTTSGPGFYHGYDLWQLRLEVMKSITERLDVDISEGIGITGVDGRPYSWVGIGSASLAVPFYIIGKMIGAPEVAVYLMNQLFGAATVVFIFLFSISLGYSSRASLLVSIFYGLGTMAWPLAKQPFDHTIETCFILLSVYFMYLHCSDKKVSHLLYSAASIGVAFITRPTSLLVVPPLFLMMAFYHVKESGIKITARLMAKDTVLFFIALLPFMSLFLWYNHYRFGSVFETGYQLIAERTGLSFFTGTPLLTGLSGLLVSPAKGFFYYSPVALLFFFSIKSFIKKYPALGFSFILIIVSYLLFLSKNIYWHGDWAWGPRYLLVLAPFFIIPVAEIFDSSIWKKKLLRVLVYSVFAVSIVIQIAAVSVDYRKYFFNLYSEEDVKFVIAGGKGVQSIYEPPSEIYFNWHTSPILAQFGFVYNMAKHIEDYEYVPVSENAPIAYQMRSSPFINVFDFWWLYRYYVDRSSSELFVVLLLFLLSVYTFVRLWNTLNR